MFASLRYDLQSIRSRDPAARSCIEIFLLYPGVHAVMWHRLAHRLQAHQLYFFARLISQLVRFFTGIEIHPGATIGKGLMIDHGSGVVIGETAVIGDDCTLYQGVTLGGTGKEMGKRHPTLGNHVIVGSGAKVLGPFSVGDYAKIASNAVVLSEIPPHATAVGVPAKVVRQNGKKVEELDHIHIPDPIALELSRLTEQIDRLTKRLERLERLETDSPPAIRKERNKT